MKTFGLTEEQQELATDEVAAKLMGLTDVMGVWMPLEPRTHHLFPCYGIRDFVESKPFDEDAVYFKNTVYSLSRQQVMKYATALKGDVLLVDCLTDAFLEEIRAEERYILWSSQYDEEHKDELFNKDYHRNKHFVWNLKEYDEN
jgi:hypothetical protein